MVKPIKPSQVVDKKKETIPDEVIESFNELIAINWNGSSSIFKQSDAVQLISGKMDLTSNEIFKRKYLDVEEIFRKAGWRVHYDKPGYNETYPATFEFSKS